MLNCMGIPSDEHRLELERLREELGEQLRAGTAGLNSLKIQVGILYMPLIRLQVDEENRVFNEAYYVLVTIKHHFTVHMECLDDMKLARHQRVVVGQEVGTAPNTVLRVVPAQSNALVDAVTPAQFQIVPVSKLLRCVQLPYI